MPGTFASLVERISLSVGTGELLDAGHVALRAAL